MVVAAVTVSNTVKQGIQTHETRNDWWEGIINLKKM